RLLARMKSSPEIVRVNPGQWQFITEPEVHRQPAVDVPVILNKRIDSSIKSALVEIGARHHHGFSFSEREICASVARESAGKCKRSHGIEPRSVQISELQRFEARLHGMPVSGPGNVIAELPGLVHLNRIHRGRVAQSQTPRDGKGWSDRWPD